MAVPYANCFQLPKVNPKCHLFSSSNGLSTRITPAHSCLNSSGPVLHLEAKVNPLLDIVKWDDKGLAVAIAQNVDTGAVLMQGFVNKRGSFEDYFFQKGYILQQVTVNFVDKGRDLNEFHQCF